jgi:cell division protein FtsQ
VLALVGILGVAGWALLGSRLLVVRVIAVTGTHLVPAAQVIKAADVPPGTPLIRVDPAQVAARVEAIRQVASAQVTKDWPDGLSITVRERVAVMTARASDGYDQLDADGVVVTTSASRPAGLPLLVTSVPGGQLRGDQGVAAVAQVLAKLPSWLSRQVARVSVQGADGTGGTPVAGLAPSVTLYLSGGQTVVWGDAGSSGAKARELAILMGDRASYYDLSAPGTVVTR